MFISGFTFVCNAILLDYPVIEAIKSVLPLCDEVVVVVGKSEDETLQLIEQLAAEEPRIKIVQSIWDDSLRTGGRVLALETDKALAATNPQADWCIYVQADEVIHEASYAAIRVAMQQHLYQTEITGLLFDYTHFYGSYAYVGTARRWYRREVRIVRRSVQISSWRDAQGFRRDGKKLLVAHSGGQMYHYGWVKHPQQQQQKQQRFHRLWHDDAWVQTHVGARETYQYSGEEPIALYEGKHPSVMQKRIASQDWAFTPDLRHANGSLKERLSAWVEKWTGWRLGEYRNYRLR